MLAEAAIQGLGVTLLPDFIISEALADGSLIRISGTYERMPLTLFALYPSRQSVPAKTRIFIDYMVETLE